MAPVGVWAVAAVLLLAEAGFCVPAPTADVLGVGAATATELAGDPVGALGALGAVGTATRSVTTG